MSEAIQLQHVAKGTRPQFSENPEVDRVMAITLALVSEFSVLHDRLDAVERVLDGQGTVTRQAIEQWQPDAAAAAERDAWRKAMLERVLYILRAEASGA